MERLGDTVVFSRINSFVAVAALVFAVQYSTHHWDEAVRRKTKLGNLRFGGTKLIWFFADLLLVFAAWLPLGFVFGLPPLWEILAYSLVGGALVFECLFAYTHFYAMPRADGTGTTWSLVFLGISIVLSLLVAVFLIVGWVVVTPPPIVGPIALGFSIALFFLRAIALAFVLIYYWDTTGKIYRALREQFGSGKAKGF